MSDMRMEDLSDTYKLRNIKGMELMTADARISIDHKRFHSAYEKYKKEKLMTEIKNNPRNFENIMKRQMSKNFASSSYAVVPENKMG